MPLTKLHDIPMTAPNIIFCNLQNSGSSAVDPVLKELLTSLGYSIPPFGPEATGKLCAEVSSGHIAMPFYHWTHDPVETFEEMLGNANYRFIYLHRDPRDAAVSWAHDFQAKRFFGDLGFNEILETVITHVQPEFVRAAAKWIQSDCLVITFNQVKDNLAAVVKDILDYCGLISLESSVMDPQIHSIVEKFSFESMTGRKRGEEGEMIRSGYMLRKGISGEWKKHFDANLVSICNKLMGVEITAMGYELADPAEFSRERT